MTTASTTVKIVVSMVVAAALVATRLSSSQSQTGLKGSRNLQFGGIVLASAQGDSGTGSALTFGGPAALAAGTGNSFGTGAAVGTSNGFATSPLGAASATGTGGGNSTSNSQLSVVTDELGVAATTSFGQGAGASGGNALFGPSLAAAVAAATPVATVAPPAVVEASSGSGDKKNGGGNTPLPGVPAAPTAPAFSFQQGLPTGGGGGGFGVGGGTTTTTIAPLDPTTPIEEAYGNSLANGFGFGVGSGVAVNNGGEQAGGQGGGTALGQGTLVFEIDEAFNSAFTNTGSTVSTGGGGAYVGFDPSGPTIFGALLVAPPAAATP